MEKLPTFNEFINENYYGPSSLFPIALKLQTEGKSLSLIVTYLRSLGVPEEHIKNAVDYLIQQKEHCNIMEDETGISQDEIDALIDGSPESTDKGATGATGEESKEPKEPKEPKMVKTTDDSTSDKKDALQNAIDDIEKIEKIKKVLKENHNIDLNIKDV